MLAKQGWRILNNSNSLVAEVMKAKYFPNLDFLNGQMGSNPSYVWRSLMSAQAAVKAGARKKIGDDKETNVWNAQWLPDVVNEYLTSYMPDYLRDSKVQSLIDMEGSGWDVDVLRDICNARDMDLNMRIPILTNKCKDKWFWLLEENGQFSVRSCYRWLQGEYFDAYTAFWKRYGR